MGTTPNTFQRIAAIAVILLGNLSGVVLRDNVSGAKSLWDDSAQTEIGASDGVESPPCIAGERDVRIVVASPCSGPAVLLGSPRMVRSVLDKGRACCFQTDNRPRILRMDRPLLLI
ncbi:MAG TPA: hypothetical protein VL096_14535 [Pirellulaceae bacterium]|nr:hypothetical protein [Pirellulaceae bacterium]